MPSEQCVIVTGGSSGLGLALASELVRRGCRVGLVARDPERLERAAAELRLLRPNAIVLTASLDVTRQANLSDVLSTLVRCLGGLDVVINSAGVAREGRFEQLDDAALRQVMDINYFGALNVIRALLPHLRMRRGRILNVASMAALTGVFGYTAYCGSKHALLGASAALRAELTYYGVRVQVACPGEFDSPMVAELDQYRSPENRAHTLTIPKTPIDIIVRDLLSGLHTRRFLIVPGRRTRLAALGLRLFPTLSRMLGDWRIRAARRAV